MPQSHRDTASFGKRQEFFAIARLLEKNYDVYQTLVDDQQIDCIIRSETDGEPVYLDIQIKARSKRADGKSWGHWSSLTIRPRRNFFYIFYSEPLKKYWVIPSQALVAGASPRSEKDLYDVTLAHYRKERGSDGFSHRDADGFAAFIDAFDSLKLAGIPSGQSSPCAAEAPPSPRQPKRRGAAKGK